MHHNLPLTDHCVSCQADPGRRLLHVARLLAGSAAEQPSAQHAALAAAAIRTVLLVAVASGPTAAAETPPADSWHLSDAQHIEVTAPFRARFMHPRSISYRLSCGLGSGIGTYIRATESRSRKCATGHAQRD